MTEHPVPGLVGVVDVGGSHLLAAIACEGADGPVLGPRVRADVDAAAPREQLLDALTAPLADLPAPAWVFALPGPFDYAAGRGDFTGVGKFGALAGVDLRTELSARLRVDPERVRFLNDAQAYGLGEWWGTPDRPRRSVCITLGTGVGSTFLVDGSPVESGPGVPPHGWVHLLHLDGAPLEDRVSTRAVVARHAARTGETRSVRAIAEAARQGDEEARAVLAGTMRDLGRALGPALSAFAADELVVGGSMARSWDVLGDPLAAALAEVAGLDALVVRPSALLDDAPLLGAAWWFRRAGRPASPAPTP
ncbi:ROK family protein [Microlunatus flavus]|uniref:Glucokinase n=1 Tax=Microlunatus flavus TaxID=1036181 RepID=A0A1H9AEL1_9ACTN|nr:ROK family protein [Microlunatus flavus]SEP74927.1 glucokinase [Microlunatus flavus]